MATSGRPTQGQDIDEAVKDIMGELICTICEEDRPLYVLPCQHRFCNVCLEQLSGKGSKKFPCPTCRKVCRAPYEGFKKCRLSVLVKEKLQSVQATAGLRRTENYAFRCMLDQLEKAAVEDISLLETQSAVYKHHHLYRLKEIYDKRKEFYPMPGLLLQHPWKVMKPLHPPQDFVGSLTNRQIHCLISFPIEKTVIINPSCINLHEYTWVDGQWREGRKFTILDGISQTFHSLHQMKSPYGSSYILQTITKSCSCDSLPAGRHAMSCMCYRSYPDLLYVLDKKWKPVKRWQLRCQVLAAVNGIIYCIDYHSSDHFQQGTIGKKPKHYVKRYTIIGTQLTPIHHEAMKEPRYLKLMYYSILDKTILLISDVGANKVFLFLDDEFCWEWMPNEISYQVGPVAISETTGHLYAVVRHSRIKRFDDTNVDPGDCSYVKILDWNGCETKTLRFDVPQDLRQMETKDIAVKCHEDSQTDRLFVMFDESAYQDDNSTNLWMEFNPVVDAHPVHSLIIMLQHWVNATGKWRVNRYILNLVSHLFVALFAVMTFLIPFFVRPEVTVSLIVMVLLWVLAGLFLLWQRYYSPPERERFDFVKHLMKLLKKAVDFQI